MRKSFIILTVLAVAVAFPVMAKDYSEVATFFDDMTKVLTDYSEAINNSTTLEEVESAMTLFTTRLQALEKKGEALEDKYPELDDMERGDPNYPKELVGPATRLETASIMVGQSSMSLMKFAGDPNFQKMMESYAEAMEEIADEEDL